MPGQARNVLELQERHHKVDAEAEVGAAPPRPRRRPRRRLLRVEVEPNYEDRYEKRKLRMYSLQKLIVLFLQLVCWVA